MKPCYCYRDEMNWLGYKGKCMGTKEFEACDCGGDKTKCNFYDYIREEGLLEIGATNCSTVGTLINVLSRYPKDMGVKIVIERKITPLSEVTVGLNLDENKNYIWLVGKNK